MASADGDLCKQLVTNFRRIRGTRLYRSSDLNRASDKQIRQMAELDIQAILDLRSSKEWFGEKTSPLDSHYLKVAPYSDLTTYQTINDTDRQALLGRNVDDGKKTVGFHYYNDFVDTAFIRQLIWASPWYMKPIFLLFLLMDLPWGIVRVSFRVLLYHINCCGGLRQQMIDMLEWKGQVINEALRLLSTPGNCPAVLMCSAGKDRTGLLSALVQSVCQVDRETIIADFVQTDAEWESERDVILAKVRGYNFCDEMAYAPPRVMSELLQHIDVKYGSVSAYLESIGFCSLMQEKLRQNIQMEETTASGGE